MISCHRRPATSEAKIAIVGSATSGNGNRRPSALPGTLSAVPRSSHRVAYQVTCAGVRLMLARTLDMRCSPVSSFEPVGVDPSPEYSTGVDKTGLPECELGCPISEASGSYSRLHDLSHCRVST